MGLRSYALASEREPIGKKNARNDIATVGDMQFHSWNKHVQLHEWICKRADEQRQFGFGETLELNIEDLCQLATDLLQSQLYPLEAGQYFTIRLCDDLEFIAKAREHIAQGRYIYYTSATFS